MAAGGSDALLSALDDLLTRHCGDESARKSKEYCIEFCTLVEEHTGRWQVPLPQLKVLRAALCSFTTAAVVFPAECQHIHYTLSSLAVSFFELMLFFSKEEFAEYPLKDIIDSFQACHSRLLRHGNIYMQQVKQVIKVGGPWESPVLQDILQEAPVPQTEVEEYLSSEVPLFLELRVRYLQACERLQEAMALAKSCLENRKAGKHLYFHQAYLTCLYKASLHEHLHKEMAEIDGHDAVEIICNTESVEKDELLLSLCKAFLKQQLHNGDMYYIWDLVFLWSRLFLRAHPSGEGFLVECHHLVSTVTNIRAIFPFIKVVNAELGTEGEQFCVKLCARGLQTCDLQANPEIHSLLCKTLAFLLPYDLEVCQACALLVFCQERSLEAYKTVCLLYTHPGQEQHPRTNPVPTNIRFYILQVLKERLCFDPEFWSLLTLRTYCLELISDQAMKAAVLSEMAEDEEQYQEEPVPGDHTTGLFVLGSSPSHDLASISHSPPTLESGGGLMESQPVLSDSTLELGVNGKKCRRRRICWRQKSWSDDDADMDNDPEFKSNITADACPEYSHTRNRAAQENHKSTKPKRQREYLSRCVKNQIFKRKGRKRRWLLGLPRFDPGPVVNEATVVKINGKKRGRKPLPKLELSYPDNELCLQDQSGGEEESETAALHRNGDEPLLIKTHSEIGEGIEQDKGTCDHSHTLEKGECGTNDCMVDCVGLEEGGRPQAEVESMANEEASEALTTEAHVALCPGVDSTRALVQMLHNYCVHVEVSEGDGEAQPLESTTDRSQNGGTKEGNSTQEEAKDLNTKATGKLSCRDKALRSKIYRHLRHYCTLCTKYFNGLNVTRHAISHLRGKRLVCIFCSRHFRQFRLAKRHVLEHIDEMCNRNTPSVMETKEGDVDLGSEGHAGDVDLGSEGRTGDIHLGSEGRTGDIQLGSEGRTGDIQLGSEGRTGDIQLGSEGRTGDIQLGSEGRTGDIQLGSEGRTGDIQLGSEGRTGDIQLGSEGRTGDIQLGREGRIIRNLRRLLKRSLPGQKSHLSTTGHRWQGAPFKDEQVVIEEDFVIVKDPSFLDRGQSAENGKPPDENAAGDFIYHLCPSVGCDKVFLKMGSSYVKHAVKTHTKEDKVLEKTFLWTKSKCPICFRRMEFLQQYKDHMQLHNTSGRLICCHQDCDDRFSTFQKLRGHLRTHQPLRAQCYNPDCKQVFPTLQGLYDHEWRHYVPAPLKQEVEAQAGAVKQMPQSDEAPWKQRMKIEEIWLQSSKEHEADTKAQHPEASDSSPLRENEETVGGVVKNGCKETSPKINDRSGSLDDDNNSITLFNGHASDARVDGTPTEPTTSNRVAPPGLNTQLPSGDKSLNVKPSKDPQVRENKATKGDATPRAPHFHIVPSGRQLPSDYLKESALTMPKRRDASTYERYAAWRIRQNRTPQQEAEAAAARLALAREMERTARQRCSRCLTTYSTLEELEEHQALDTCSALFGFDTDDES